MNLQPLEDRIVVKPGEAEETTVSGLVIPDTAKEKPQQGEVLAVGPGRRSEQTGELIPVAVNVGDTVVYSKYGGTEISDAGQDLLILNARAVLAIVGPDTKKKKTVLCPRSSSSKKRRAGTSRRAGKRMPHPRRTPPARERKRVV